MAARRKKSGWQFPSVIDCECSRKLDPAEDRTQLLPSDDVPDEYITWLPAPTRRTLTCPNCPRWIVFAPSSMIESMKARRARKNRPTAGA